MVAEAAGAILSRERPAESGTGACGPRYRSCPVELSGPSPPRRRSFCCPSTADAAKSDCSSQPGRYLSNKSCWPRRAEKNAVDSRESQTPPCCQRQLAADAAVESPAFVAYSIVGALNFLSGRIRNEARCWPNEYTYISSEQGVSPKVTRPSLLRMLIVEMLRDGITSG